MKEQEHSRYSKTAPLLQLAEVKPRQECLIPIFTGLCQQDFGFKNEKAYFGPDIHETL